ncbi:hypothetical protein SAMN05444266_101884 [Chitinophaga jiangningensis]|uniref:Gliding motility-associated lipoprotein GldB n=1 Tax=Chitinophaga jiangningensis TaxID=1419482 RepID=A0A1M6X3Y0_9BACT|nr:hypothetical protein [Chitinophaga jiangningensis]SHL00717.1 hypothetical protein SAMN05444266_101884 [Chitinophaga jiangningensis]
MQSYTIISTRFSWLLLAAVAMASCKSGPKPPDVSHISVTVSTQRFDSALFTIDTNNIQPGLAKLHADYPVFTPVYMTDIMNLGAYADSSAALQQQLHLFLTTPDFRQLETAVQQKFGNLSAVRKDLEQAFKYTKYYLPNFKTPQVVTFISGIANYGAVTVDSLLGIGLDMYMGADFPPYGMIEDLPSYMIRRFTPEYIATNAMQVIHNQLYPMRTSGTLISQILDAGRQQYFLGKVLPHTDDTIRLGYTKEQLKWCYDNEQMIWQFFIQNNLLYSTDWQDISHFMGDGPATQGMPEGSPGKIGNFVGLQIVNKYMDKHPEMSLQQLLEMKDVMEIFNEAKYRPR